MSKRTPFYDLHIASHGKIVDFAGWQMPLHYGSQLEEHHQVRHHAGMFDVSHMGVVDLHGTDAGSFLRYALANNIDKLTEGKALYTCMLNDQGGVIDDLIVYKMNPEFYRLVINAGTREKDIAWLKQQAAGKNVTLTERKDLVMLAIQGPEVKNKILPLLPQTEAALLSDLKPFHFVVLNGLRGLTNEFFIARTGYTGEDGFEIIFSASEAKLIWQLLLSAGILPCGLGARDTLRLEAGLNLYGSDMDENVTPFESNLAWTVALEPKERNFIGRDALENQAQKGVKKHLVGLVLKGPGIMRNHQKIVISGNGEGEITSGGYSPTLENSIALARIPSETNTSECFVEIRNKKVPVQIIKPPFVRNGKKCFK